ncbi:hypothetical protein ACINB_39070 [Acidovorax sp. NB1]|nr:hypothetical protein ACINB_39070 [Acidovorax sp. NB1]
MATGRGQQLLQPLAVALAEGLLHLQQGVVTLAVLRLDKGGRRGKQGTGDKRCQNSKQLHGGIM